ncbi:MAG: ribosome biogenesis GTPase Der [Pseudomonadota bacterium]
MLPVIAIVGRPNVGKSTLFNCLTQGRDALVADMPGMTRDRIYGRGELSGQPFIIIDTGGLNGDDEQIADLTEAQSHRAIEEADKILFVVDARVGLQIDDETIAEQLRGTNKPVILVINKIDGLNPDLVAGEFSALGFAQQLSTAAAHHRGTKQLLSMTLASFMKDAQETTQQAEQAEIDGGKSQAIRVAVLGRPNVGKSTLINRLLGEERVVVCDMPGTTRDSVFIPFTYRDKAYTLIDTAGVRRRAKVKQSVEQLSVIKSLQAIEAAHVVILVIDARMNISDQDLKLLGQILKAGRALIVTVNKWDGLSTYQREQVKQELDRRLTFIPYAQTKFISALHGTGVGLLMQLVDRCYASATKPLQTAKLTAILERALSQHQPPLVKGRRVKLRYAHAGGHNPPTIIIHGNQVDRLPASYHRYLENVYREKLKLVGTPVRLVFKHGGNPFKS